MRELLLKYGLVVLSTVMTAFGITLIVLAELGVDPISTFLLGGVNYFPIRFGTGSQIFSCAFLLLNFLIDRKYFGIGSLLFSIGCGYCINQFLAIDLLNVFFINSVPNIVIVLVGIMFYGIGTGVFLYTKTGTGPLEGLMFFFSKKFKVSIKVTRMSIDGFLVLTGIGLGGIYGLGTILCICFTGPVIELSLKTLNNFVELKRKKLDGLIVQKG
ncbi:YczE/YyaS/YitT family protein [Peribacillus huizhouensis]|uniref:YitT family protein n=1 Tax=Peribacillus huizhouensis TaxID=1501239 RepID=A0ABR6CVV9_9BACI|nr:hypothetical protein [Peribacillus huizhouensis]MBA9029161.1 hypothetical protein [Peribacillus huizhouensis]